MANFIDKTYFIADINLSKGEYDDIDLFITKFEKEVLIYLLGQELYNLVINNSTVAPYKNLIEGIEYSIQWEGETKKVTWVGFKNTGKESLIAYYVYCQYMKYRVTSTQSIGEVKRKVENSFIVSAVHKIFSAWAKFEELYGYINQDSLSPSAYNYLYEHKDSFPSWVFTELKGGINSHDL
jgi:hypothetical protein